MTATTDSEILGRVLLSQVEFAVTIHRQPVPFGSTFADFDASDFDYTIRPLKPNRERLPVVEFDSEDSLPVEIDVRWEHPTGMRFRLSFRIAGIVGRSYAAYDVTVERE